ncbi:helix-turn-helix domain-containing protein [Streptomyces parvulus]|uniref:helix-turn-helix domain-containing protein n=1 Tax=Streptomyces parvulus TaxID=146923 RepID=UPI0037BD9B32
MDEQTAPPGYYGTRDVARALNTSPGAVRNLVYRGRLARAGGTERHPWYRVEDVAALLAERRTRAAA